MTRRVKGLVIALVAVVVVAGLLVVAEFVARGIVADRVEQQLRSVFALDAAQPIEVSVAGPIVLTQLAGGSLTRIEVSIPGVEAGSLRADVDLLGEGVALDPAAPSDRIEATLSVAESDVTRALGALGDTAIRDIELVDGEVRLVTGFDVFGLAVELVAGIVPSIESGVVTLAPTSLELNGNRVELDELRGQLGDFADPIIEPLLAGGQLCIAEALPVALTEQRVDVRERELVVVVGGSDVALGGPELAERGTCP